LGRTKFKVSGKSPEKDSGLRQTLNRGVRKDALQSLSGSKHMHRMFRCPITSNLDSYVYTTKAKRMK
jgi:hypothetical protein